jgi:hypothetical protein
VHFRIAPGASLLRTDSALALQTQEQFTPTPLGQGTNPEVWLEMQTAHDLWLAEQKPMPDVHPLRLAA